VEVCRTSGGVGVPIDPGLLVPPAGADLPTVVGVLDSGAEVAFTATVLPGGTGTCKHVAYTPADADAEWTLLRIKAFALGTIKVISLCAVTVDARDRQKADQEMRDKLKDLGHRLANPVTADTPPARTISLDPDATYQIRVEWKFQSWRARKTGDQPPTISKTWKPGALEKFTFHTAAWGPVADGSGGGLGTDPADGGAALDERTFDARGLVRYVTYSQPADGPTELFFAGDPIKWGFMVDHIPGLLAKFGADLKVRVLRTDPPPGTLKGVPEHQPGTPHKLDVATGLSFSPDTATYFAADGRIALAISGSSCVGAPPRLGSSTASVTAALEPGADYDLFLYAVRPNEEIAIARSHFRTSRYEDVPALLTALGLPPTSPLQPVGDHVVEAPPALSTLPTGVGDGLMDDALGKLGLDPHPVPDRPRATVLWQAPAAVGGDWSVLGILLEAEEPLHRAPLPSEVAADPTTTKARLDLPKIQIQKLDSTGGVASTTDLATSLRNVSGTLLLLRADQPVSLTSGASYELRLPAVEAGAVSSEGRALLFDRPFSAILEGG
jgi:hypothetical protein